MALSDLLKKKEKILAQGDDVFLEQIAKTESDIYKKIAAFINKFKTSDGNFVNDKTTTQLLASIKKQIEAIIKKSTFTDRIKGFLRNFDELERLTKGIHLDLNNISLSKISLGAHKKEAIDRIVSNLTVFNNINANVSDPIRRIIFESVITGRGVTDTKKRLREIISGDEKKFGIMRRWVSQISRDALGQYDGLVQDTIRKEYDLNAYQYDGSIIKDSRPQCVRWVKDLHGIILVEELDREISWASRNGSGHNDATTSETFAVYRGGFNCRHSATPFKMSEEAVEKLKQRRN